MSVILLLDVACMSLIELKIDNTRMTILQYLIVIICFIVCYILCDNTLEAIDKRSIVDMQIYYFFENTSKKSIFF